MSRVFVVDDHADDAALHASVLGRAGYEAVPFTSPLEALEAITADRPDVVLVALLMPELDGFELIHALRSDPATRDQRVVVASALYTEREFARSWSDLADCTFLAEPATADALVASVEQALRSSASAAELPADFEQRQRGAVHRKLLEDARRRQEAERAATRSKTEAREPELRAVFEGARDALVVVDKDLRCVRVNDAACRLLGRPEGELIGMIASDVVAPESIADLEAGWAAALREESGAGFVTILRPDGTRRTTEYSGAINVTPDIHIVSLRDVTERVATETALQRTMAAVSAVERRYADLIEALPDGIVAVDGDGTIVLVNAQTELMFGYVRGELIGQPVELLIPAHDDAERVRHREQFDAGSRSRVMAAGLDITGRRKDGTEFPVEVSLSRIQSAAGQLVTSVVTDVTERRRLEQRLQQAQKLDAIGVLAGGVAHDFNNILQVIVGYVTALQHRATNGSGAEELSEIANAVERAALLTKQLLAFSKRQVLQPVVLDLNEIAGEMKRMLTRVVGEERALSIELDPGLGQVHADRSHMEQVLANLVVNARDATPTGGRIAITTRAVELGDERDGLDLPPGTYARICVSDTGKGMDEETAARAFEPFFTTKGEGQGTGLGLATVHGIVTQSGGRVRIETAQDDGTTISIYLPTVAQAPSLPSTAGPTEGARGGNERILLVEDEPVVRRLLESVLTGQGYEVTAVADGAAAFAVAADAKRIFDLLVTDFVLPDLNGRELAAQLVASGATPAVLYVSGYAPDADFSDAGAGSQSEFLQKPFTNDTFTQSVRRLLDTKSPTP